MDRKGAGLAGLLLAGTMVFGMTACGGGSDKDESSSKAESSATVPAASSNGSSSSDDESSNASASDFLDSDCQDAVAAYTSIFASAFGSSSMLSDEDKQQMEDNLEDLEGKVPSELEDDISTISDAYRGYFEAIGDMNITEMMKPENASRIDEATEKIDSAEVTEAQENIESFFRENCPSMAGLLNGGE